MGDRNYGPGLPPGCRPGDMRYGTRDPFEPGVHDIAENKPTRESAAPVLALIEHLEQVASDTLRAAVQVAGSLGVPCPAQPGTSAETRPTSASRRLVELIETVRATGTLLDRMQERL